MTTSWTTHREEAFRFEQLDLDGNVVGTLPGVKPGGQLEFSIFTTIRGSGNVTVDTGAHVGAVDWASSQVRVSYVTGATTAPLITAIPRAPVEAHKAAGTSVNVELFDRTLILSEDAYGVSYGLDTGENIIEAVGEIITSSGIPASQLRLTPSSAVLAFPLVWEAGVTKLRMVNDLLSAAGYFAIYCDGYGRFRADPYITPTARGISWVFADDENGLYLPEWTFDADVFTVPNKYVCVGRSGGEAAALVATETDEDPLSPFSFQRRKRWITKTDIDVEASSQAVLDMIAARRLLEAQQVSAVAEIRHPWLPFGLNHVVSFTNRDLTMRAVVAKQTVRLATGGLVTSSLRRVA